MVLLRYLYVVALVLWVGGLVSAGALVAPSVFGVLQAWNPLEGRVAAGFDGLIGIKQLGPGVVHRLFDCIEEIGRASCRERV